MKHETLDDLFRSGIRELGLAKERKRLGYAIAFGILIDLIIISFIGGTDLFFRHLLNNLTLLIVIPALGFGLGFFVAMFPYKDMSYSAKYLRSSQWSIVVLSIILFFVSVYLVLTFIE